MRQNNMLTTADPLPKRKRALALCLLLGFVGAHRFYARQYFLGSLYLLFFWTLIPGLAALVDAVVLASQDDDDFAEDLREAPYTPEQR
jgi:TM2 domain-containing membrane protein YozV